MWIEIPSGFFFPVLLCRGSREPCGSKLLVIYTAIYCLRRGSREPCGSKSLQLLGIQQQLPSRLARAYGSKSLSFSKLLAIIKSRLARALWIEIAVLPHQPPFCFVEARESLVDRNPESPGWTGCTRCRGSREPCGSKFHQYDITRHPLPSRLARALWIEIIWRESTWSSIHVEARESLVDRNFLGPAA